MTFSAGAVSGDAVTVGIGASAGTPGNFTFTADATTAAAAATAYAAGATVAGHTLAAVGATVTFTQDTASAGAYASTVTAVQATAAAATSRTLAVAAADAVTALSTADVSTQSGAATAILQIDSSITMVDAERAKLGAFSNRLEHTVSNLSSMVENTSAARSRIADADFAVESANLAKNQVLQQAGTAMLSQANASTQNVLSLLK
jgi:flagellin